MKSVVVKEWTKDSKKGIRWKEDYTNEGMERGIFFKRWVLVGSLDLHDPTQ